MLQGLASYTIGLGLALVASAAAEDFLRQKVIDVIRWQAYWEGNDSLGSNYRAGSSIEARVLETKSHRYVFLAPIHLRIDLVSFGGSLSVASVGELGIAEETNAAAAARFLQMVAGPMGCATLSEQAVGGRSGVLPQARPCASSEEIVSDKAIPFELPRLVRPASIRDKTVPSDKELLVSEVYRYVDSTLPACRSSIATVPFYSDEDPRVYVYVRLGGDCVSGIAVFSRPPNGRWEFGKFLPDVPKEELSEIIKRIKSNAAITIGR